MPSLHTLGRFELRDGDGRDAKLVVTQPKRLALLTYLAVIAPGEYCRRDTLLGLFWPELDQEESRRALRQALHHLRRALGDALCTRADDQVGIAPGGLWCDAVEAERAGVAGRDAELLELHRGDFLQGVFVPEVAQELEEWVERTRERLRDRVRTSARRLAGAAEAAGDLVTAVAAAERGLELAPDDEPCARQLLALLQRQGDRSKAQRVYATFTRRLEEYGVVPGRDTVALMDRIRTEPFPGAPLPVREPPAPAPVESAPVAAAAAPVAVVAPAPAAPTSRSRRRWTAAALTGVVLLGGAIAGETARRSPDGRDPTSLVSTGLLAVADRLFIVDFESRGADSTLGFVVSEALRVDLGQSRLVRVMSRGQMRGALRLLKQQPDVSINDTIARLIAASSGVKAFVTGSVTPLGRGMALSARIVSGEKGEELAVVRETAADSNDVVPAIDRLSRALRRRIGETLHDLQADPPLQEVTTASIPALRLYTRAISLSSNNADYSAAIPLLEQAVTLDTGFASAYRALGSAYSNRAEKGKAEVALTHAVANQARLPLWERQMTLGSYYREVTQEYDKSAAAYEALLKLYPQDIAPMNNLAFVYGSQRRFAPAESLYRRILRADSSFAAIYIGLMHSLAYQGRFTEARHALDDAERRFPTYQLLSLAEVHLAVDKQDWDAAEHFQAARLATMKEGDDERIDGHLTLGEIALLRGRLAQSERHLRQTMTIARDQSPPRDLAAAIVLGWLELRYRARPDTAAKVVDDALARHPLATLEPADRQYPDLMLFYTALGRADRAHALMADAEHDPAAAPLLKGVDGNVMRGALAMAEGRPEDAVREFKAADAADACTVCELPELAQALEAAGDIDAAIAIYERYFSTPWKWRFETDAPSLGWSIKRQAELYEKQRQPARAAEQYVKLLRLWDSADPDLAPMLREVRARTALEGAAP